MTSVDLPLILSIAPQNSRPLIETRTKKMTQSLNTWKSEVVSKNVGSKNGGKYPPLSQISSDCRKKTPPPGDKTISSARDFRSPRTHQLVPTSAQSKQKGLYNGSTKRPTLVHSYSTPTISSTSRLKTPRSACVSTKTLGSRGKATAESGSSQTENSIIPIKSFNSLCSLRDNGFPNKPSSGLNSPRLSNITSLSSPRQLLNAGASKQSKKAPNTARGFTSKPLARSFTRAGKSINKKVTTENKKNQPGSNRVDDTDERIINWLIGVEDSEPEEPVAPFIEYSDQPLQTDIAVHIVYNED
ncbi:uncharacterized protein LOC115211115 [Octopus sinensis]|uniref:Uncharacterized protein LOC115211115 n=1 Tax=Octopus sinensis TaxID=2607531 RepID=A0A6P7SBY2_9MOLL|nr:uncharacterized protein LOC115211115 [Octopus sinensis]